MKLELAFRGGFDRGLFRRGRHLRSRCLGDFWRGLFHFVHGQLSLAGNHGVGKVLHDQLDAADPVVVAGNRQIDVARITVGIDQGNGRNPQSLGFFDRVAFLAGIDNEQALGQTIHRCADR